MFSAHPFPLDGLPDDRTEQLVYVMHKILVKIAEANSTVSVMCLDDLTDLIASMSSLRSLIWFHCKVFTNGATVKLDLVSLQSFH